MESRKSKKKISGAEMSGYLTSSRFNQSILWLLTIPREELSDSMLEARVKMENLNQNEIWLIDYFENYLSEEIKEFVDWNDALFKGKIYDY